MQQDLSMQDFPPRSLDGTGFGNSLTEATASEVEGRIKRHKDDAGRRGERARHAA